MAKKPGSWKKINKLTGKARVFPKNGKMRVGLFSVLFITSATVFSTASYFLINGIINFNGIQTSGEFPSWDFNKGKGFEVDFGKAKLNNISSEQKEFERIKIEETSERAKYEKVVSTSLKLQFAYNDIFERAPADFIAKNQIYNSLFPNTSKIEIVNIFTDEFLKHKLDINDVQKNNFNVFNSTLFLTINYNGSRVNTPILMPTIFYGNEGFLSNFLQFKLLNILHKDDIEGTSLENQSSILGEHSSKLLMTIDGKDNDGKRLNTDKLYKSYADLFEAFFKDNQGYKKEFTIKTKNPYSNFVISGANKNDGIFVDLEDSSTHEVSKYGLKYDATKFLFDINQIFDLEHSFTPNIITTPKKDNLNDIKYLLPLVSFLKNIYIKTGDDSSIPRDFLTGSNEWWWQDILTYYEDHNSNRYITTSNDDKYYFMFLPNETTIPKMLIKLKSDLHKMINQVIHAIEDGEPSNIGDLLIKSFEKIKENLLKYGMNSKYWWLFSGDYLPFQTYWNTESTDYTTVKKDRHAQNISPTNSEFAVIDSPALHEIIEVKDDKYDVNDNLSRNKLFVDLWDSRSDSKKLNTIILDKNYDLKTIIDQFLKTIIDQFLKNTFEFLNNNNNIISNMPKDAKAWTELIKDRYESNIIYLDKFNIPTDSLDNALSIDFIGTLKKELKTDIPLNLQKLTFRFNIVRK